MPNLKSLWILFIEFFRLKLLKMSNLSRKLAGSNWENSVLNTQNNNKATSPQKNGNTTTKKNIKKEKPLMKFVAMDCEMVGIGPNGSDDMLARVSIVNQKGDVLLDKYVKPREKVTDYRTSVSGIRPNDIENAEEFDKVQNDVIKLLQYKILVGHSINNDLTVLFIKHPHKFIRDTAKYRPLAKLVSNGATPSLKRLTKAILGIDIQNGEHNSVEDARATMNIYNRFSADWEKYIKKTLQRNQHRHSRKS